MQFITHFCAPVGRGSQIDNYRLEGGGAWPVNESWTLSRNEKPLWIKISFIDNRASIESAKGAMVIGVQRLCFVSCSLTLPLLMVLPGKSALM